VLSVLDLYGDSSFGMAFIPQWIKKHRRSAWQYFLTRRLSRLFPWKRMVHRMRWHFAISSPRIRVNWARKEKKEELDEQPKISKK
jgi:hypothetical protein